MPVAIYSREVCSVRGGLLMVKHQEENSVTPACLGVDAPPALGSLCYTLNDPVSDPEEPIYLVTVLFYGDGPDSPDGATLEKERCYGTSVKKSSFRSFVEVDPRFMSVSYPQSKKQACWHPFRVLKTVKAVS